MIRRIAIVLLAFGTVAGYGSGFASLRHRHHERRAVIERHVARVCVDAANDARRGALPTPPSAHLSRW